MNVCFDVLTIKNKDGMTHEYNEFHALHTSLDPIFTYKLVPFLWIFSNALLVIFLYSSTERSI